MRSYQSNGRRMSKEPPWGTRVDPKAPGRLIADTEEVATIDTIKELYEGGMGLRAIARELTKQGVDRRGKTKWNHVLIRRILIREGLHRVAE